jgi:hypothetical protein
MDTRSTAAQPHGRVQSITQHGESAAAGANIASAAFDTLGT